MKTFKLAAVVVALAIAGPAWAQAYEYDAAGRLTKVTYADGKTIAYTYDANGNVTQLAADPPKTDAPVDPPVNPTKPNGCGCGATGGQALWGALVGALALRRRRAQA